MPGINVKRLVATAALAIAAGGATVASGATSSSPFRTVASPAASTHPNLRASAAISANDVWAVGSADTFDPNTGAGTKSVAEHWNGSTWKVVATPANFDFVGGLTAVSAVSSTDVWASGRSTIEHWNGTAWSIVPSLGRDIRSIFAISSNNVYAVGTGGNGGAPGFVEHWNGSKWSGIQTALPGHTLGGTNAQPISVSASSASDVWVIGDQPGNPYTSFAEHFNGKTWTSGPLSADPNMFAVLAVSPTNAWAVGQTISHWNGKTWTQVPNVANGSGAANLYAITKLSATDLWAVGTFNTTSGTQSTGSTFAEHFNGTSWSVVRTPSPGTDPLLFGVSAAGGHVYAVGFTETSGPNAIPQVEQNLILENDNG